MPWLFLVTIKCGKLPQLINLIFVIADRTVFFLLIFRYQIEMKGGLN